MEGRYNFCEESLAAKEFKRGLFQKCHGLSLLTGCSVFLRIADKDDGIQFYGSRDQVKKYINRELVHQKTDQEISGDTGLPWQQHGKCEPFDIQKKEILSGNGSDSKRHQRKSLAKIANHNTDSDSGNSSASNVITLSDDDDGDNENDNDGGDDDDGCFDGDIEKEELMEAEQSELQTQSDQSEDRDCKSSTHGEGKVIKPRRPQILDVMTEIIKRQDGLKGKRLRPNSLASFGQKIADTMIARAMIVEHRKQENKEVQEFTNQNDSNRSTSHSYGESKDGASQGMHCQGITQANYSYREVSKNGNITDIRNGFNMDHKVEHQKSEHQYSDTDSYIIEGDVQGNTVKISTGGGRQQEPLDFSRKQNGDLLHASKVFIQENGTPVNYDSSEGNLLYSGIGSDHSAAEFDYYKQSSKAKRRYHCGTCSKAFTQLSVLKEHMKTHTGEKPYVCKICGKEFSHPSNFKRHERLVHSNSKDKRRHQCPICFKAFPLSHHLKEHFRIHSGERPYQCKVCGQRFKQSSTLKTHQKRHFISKVYDAGGNVYPNGDEVHQASMRDHTLGINLSNSNPSHQDSIACSSSQYNNMPHGVNNNSFPNVAMQQEGNSVRMQVPPEMMYHRIPTSRASESLEHHHNTTMEHRMPIPGIMLTDSHPTFFQQSLQNLAFREHAHRNPGLTEGYNESISHSKRNGHLEPNKLPPPLIHCPSKDSREATRSEYLKQQQSERDMSQDIVDRSRDKGSSVSPPSSAQVPISSPVCPSDSPPKTPIGNATCIQSLLCEPIKPSYDTSLLPHQPWYRHKMKGDYSKPLKRIENIASKESRSEHVDSEAESSHDSIEVVSDEAGDDSGNVKMTVGEIIHDKKNEASSDGNQRVGSSPSSQSKPWKQEKLLSKLLQSDIQNCFKCHICDKTLSSAAGLHDHMKVDHWVSQSEKYVCQECGRSFTNQSNFKRHQRLMHDEVKVRQHQCPVCMKAFPLGHHLKEHFRIHSGERPYKCDVCGKGFTQSSTLKNHKKTHSSLDSGSQTVMLSSSDESMHRGSQSTPAKPDNASTKE